MEAPSARRLLIGAALRRYREDLGFVLEDAARVLECDRSKISRIETGQRSIRPKELRELLTEYGVDEREQSTLTAIAQAGSRNAQRPGYTFPSSYREYLALEEAASEIFIYDPQHIPDLLQTSQYAQARGTRNPSVQAGAELNLVRQRLLCQRHVRLTALIGEAALRQAHGDPEVMRNQLRALAAEGERTVVYVLPFRCVPPSSGPTTILRFATVVDLGAVYLPGLSGGVCLTGQQDITSHTEAFGQLRRSALSPGVSARLIRDIAAA